MPLENKIDSNITGLAYAKEAVIGFLPGEGGNAGSPVWRRLLPVSYEDFGGEITTVAPQTINPSRQKRKGVITDNESSGGFEHYMTFHNLTDLMQGAMFAALRRKGTELVTAVDIDGANPDEYEVASTASFVVGSLIKGINFANSANNSLNLVTVIVTDVSVEVASGQLVAEASPPATARIDVVGFQAAAGDIDVTTVGDFATLTSTTLDFTTLGLVPGQWIFIGGEVAGDRFTTAANNGFKRIRSIAANAVVIDKSNLAMVTEANASATIRLFFGDVLRNETGALIVRSTYQLERTLGAPDSDSPSDVQSEVVVGAVLNELTINIPSADLLTVDVSFLGTDTQQRISTVGPKQSGVLNSDIADEYNTSSDVGRMRLSVISTTSESVSALFAYVTEASITLNNNMSPNKAVGVLGAFDMTAGIVEIGGELTAYFTTIEAVRAVRNNSSLTFDLSLIKDNTGIIFDMPLLSLSNGRPEVELNEPIMIPLEQMAATGEDINANLNHTLLITYFNYLPEAAM